MRKPPKPIRRYLCLLWDGTIHMRGPFKSREALEKVAFKYAGKPGWEAFFELQVPIPKDPKEAKPGLYPLTFRPINGVVTIVR